MSTPADAASTGSDTSPQIGARLDRLPWSPLHTRLTLALGIGWLLDSFEVNMGSPHETG